MAWSLKVRCSPRLPGALGLRSNHSSRRSSPSHVMAYLQARAQAKGVKVTYLVNDLLNRDIVLIEAVK